MKIVLICLGIVIVVFLVRFVVKGANYGLIARNLTNNYFLGEQSKDTLGDLNLPISYRLFIAGYANAIIYIKRDERFARTMYDICRQFDAIKTINSDTLSMFAELMMVEYFVMDDKLDRQSIVDAVSTQKGVIRSNVELAIKNQKVGTLKPDLIYGAMHWYQLFEDQDVYSL